MCAAELLRNTFIQVKIFICLLELVPLFICEATVLDYEAVGKSRTFQVQISTLRIF